MGTIPKKKKAETRISAGLRPDQTVKVRSNGKSGINQMQYHGIVDISFLL